MPPQATDKQLSFLTSLFNEREAASESASQMKKTVEAGKVSKAAASRWITFLLSQPRKAKAESSKPVYIDPPLGMHEAAGKVVKVYKTRNGYTVAKVLSTEGGKPEFHYAGKAGLRGLSEKTVMSAESAAAFGKSYGICVNCAAHLTDERSIFAGYGPVCASNNGWAWGEKVDLKGLEAAPTPTESTPVEESPVPAPEPVYEDPEEADAAELHQSDLFSLL